MLGVMVKIYKDSLFYVHENGMAKIKVLYIIIRHLGIIKSIGTMNVPIKTSGII